MKQADLDRNGIIDKDEVLKMARQAGLDDEVLVPWSFEIQAFAKLVDTKATAKEREACAKECEQIDEDGECPDQWDWHSSDYAAAIRARGEAT